MSLKKSLVLLSAGLDSTVNLFLAHKKTEVKQTLTFDYGQRAVKKEIECAQKISKHLNIPHSVISLDWLKNISTSSLTNLDLSVPVGSAVSIDDLRTSVQTAKSVWVPNRNGVFLNIAAAMAEAQGIDLVIPGFNLEEAATFPDNSKVYMDSVTTAFKFSTANQVQVESYTADMNKVEIVKIALQEKVPLNMIWPCYFSYDKWCGQCESCLRTGRAMKENKINFQEYCI